MKQALWFCKNCLVTTCLILSLGTSAFSQKPIEITGRILDLESHTPLEFASVSLLHSTDSSLITGGITDVDGLFAINATPGNYHLRVEFISYDEGWVDNITVEREPVSVGDIEIALSAAMLDVVEVTGERSQFQLGLDKRIFNADKDIVTRGGSAADILDNIPSVSVDIDGNVSLRGSQNVRILVDGRPSGLVGLSDNSALRMLQGDLVDRVEIVTNPSARYDAEGMAGIINIILKKEQKQGLNGSFSGNLGYPVNAGASANVNYRRRNFNFFFNYGLSYGDRPSKGNLYQEYYYGDTTLYLEQTSERISQGFSHNFRFGTDVYLTNSDVLTGSFLYRHSNEKNQNTITYNDFDRFYELAGITIREEEEDEIEPNLEYSLDYKHEFRNKDHTLKASLAYDDNSEVETSTYLERVYEPDHSPGEIPDLHQRSRNEEGNISWNGQVDYVHPFSKDGKFEAGYKVGIRDIGTEYLVEELDDGSWEPIAGLSNDFNYDENIQAIYLIYGNKLRKFAYQAGLRSEHSHVVTELIQTQERNERNYIDFFPSLHLGYDLSGENTVQISYSRRIRRPHFHWLNPFFTYSDSRNRYGGNPNLDPEYTNSIELGHIKYWESSSITSSIYYRHSTDVVDRIRTIEIDSVTRDTFTQTIPQNLASRQDFGFELTFSKDIIEAWKIDGNVNFFRSIIDGKEYGDADSYSWSMRLNSRTTFFDKIETQLRLNFRGPQETTQGRNKAIFHADIGISTDLLRNRATLTLNVSDLFNSRKRKYVTEGDGFYSEGDWQWRARQLMLNFTYRLNQKKERDPRRGRDDGGMGEDIDLF